MGLSRLDNFLKSTRGTILYVDPNSLDSTDSIENQGNSLARPFKTLQRALIESARFSYQRGKDNDRFGKTTILLYPGDHIIDNRPGYIPLDDGSFKTRDNTSVSDFSDWSLNSNFDLSSPNNELYKLNSVHGGVIVPRGTSIVGIDLRKTKIIPRYVPHPDIGAEGANIESSAIFRVTGSCYFWQFSIFDCDPNSTAFYNYTKSQIVPNFSHHRLRAFEYADGTNNVKLNDAFFTNFDAGRTDLDMYYEKVGLVYGQTSGREIPNDYPPENIVDIEPVVDEYRIVGPKGFEIGIESISASGTTITVTTEESFDNISINTAIQIDGVSPSGYDGKFVVSEVVSDTQFKYIVPIEPTAGATNTTSATASLIVDTVSSSSPYIFNISLRSVYGMCGLLADGDKATGFKSMVVAQFTGIGLQKDENAFVQYDSETGTYLDINDNLSNLSSNSLSVYKPEYENFHIKATNDAYLQLVSVFAIGFAQQYVAENGGDISINNSNSNFGSKALVSSGFKREAFRRDDIGYITHIVSPQEIESPEYSIEFDAIDVEKTISVGNTSRLYLYNQELQSSPPNHLIDGYRIGARPEDKLYVNVFENGSRTSYSTPIVIPNDELVGTSTTRREDLEITFEKSFNVSKNLNGSDNKIISNTIIFDEEHQFLTGESVRIISDDGSLPDGIVPGKVYYAITDSLIGIANTEIKLASSYIDAVQGNNLTINSRGGNLTVVSRVSDKISGEIGHPIQWDNSENQWYINVSDTTIDNLGDNGIYQAIVGLGTTGLGESTPRTYFKRKVDTRNYGDSIYKVRYVLPKDANLAGRSPLDAFVLQLSSSGIVSDSEVLKYFDSTNTEDIINEPYALRSAKFISSCTYSSGTVTVTSEFPHNLSVGSEVTIKNVSSTNNTTAEDNKGYNGSFIVSSIVDSLNFEFSLGSNPGTFTNNINLRNSSLPRFYISKLENTFQLYRSQTIKEFKYGEQDGVYHLIITKSSVSPTISPFTNRKFSQSIENLYPQQNRDNPKSDPDATRSYSRTSSIGSIDVNDPEKSITKEALSDFINDVNIGIGITNIVSNSVGLSHTIYTEIDHGLFPVSEVSIVGGGTTFVTGTYYNVPLETQSGITGKYATAVVTVGASGTVTAVKIMHGGSAYEVGDSLKITDSNVDRNPTGTDAILTVSSIIDSTNDSLQVIGSYSEGYNTNYRVTGVENGSDRAINVISSEVVSGFTTTGVGVTDLANSFILKTGKALGISTISHNSVTGITSITFTSSHGLQVNDKIRVGGATSEIFNGDFIIKNVKSTLPINAPEILEIDLGVKQALTPPGGSIFVYPNEFSSKAGTINAENETTSSRLTEIYGGVSGITTSTIDVSATESDPFEITDALSLGFNLGDFIQIDNEILRISRSVTNNTVYAHRAVLGTYKESHKANSIVKKIVPIPIELRRNSIIKASAHTFEYVGFGPGNYSTALPDKQNRVLSEKEEVVAQSTRYDGGVSIFSGMNSDGDFYTGNKKVNSSTGEEKIFDAPIPTVTGEEIQRTNVNVGFDVLSPLEINVNRSIRVEGGPDGNLLSKFDGPVVFNNKVTSYAERGIEAKSIYLQGDQDVSRKITYSNAVPTITGNYGDVVFNSEPEELGFAGWIFSRDNTWQEFAFIGGQGVGIYSGGNYIGFSSALDIIGVGLTISVVTSNAVNGITTITIDDNPVIGISTGAFNTLVGQANQLNFVGGGITVSNVSTAGIVTIFMEKINIEALAPAGNYNTFQYHQNDDTFAGLDYFVYNDTNDNIQISDINLTRSGYIGLGTTNPSSKIEIHSDNERSIYVNSISGSGEIVRIENAFGDTKPFIIDINGHVGINTDAIKSGICLDIAESAGITGEIRFYNESRTNYVGFEAPSSIGSDIIWTLPNVVGSAYSFLSNTSTPGVLGWTSVKQIISQENLTTDDIPEGSSNLYHTVQRVVDSYLSRIGQKAGITITYNSGTQKIDYDVMYDEAPYPFTTKGFNIMY